jgi:hypothetical protein
MSSEIEVRMICQIYCGWFGCGCGEIHRERIIVQQFTPHSGQTISRIAFPPIWIEAREINCITPRVIMKIEFIESDDAAVECMFIIPVFSDIYDLAVENKLTARYAICDPTNESTKVRIAFLSIARNVIEAQHNVSNFSITTGDLNRGDDCPISYQLDTHAICILPRKSSNFLLLSRYWIFDTSKRVDAQSHTRVCHHFIFLKSSSLFDDQQLNECEMQVVKCFNYLLKSRQNKQKNTLKNALE